MVGLIVALLIYSIVIFTEDITLCRCCIFMLIVMQCALSYLMKSNNTFDTLNWLIILSVIDILITVMFCVSHYNKWMIVLGIITGIGTIYNILSYLDINYYSYYLNSLITNHYLHGLVMLIDMKNKYINILIKALAIGTMLL